MVVYANCRSAFALTKKRFLVDALFCNVLWFLYIGLLQKAVLGIFRKALPLRVCQKYFVHGCSCQSLVGAISEFPLKLCLHSLIFAIQLSWKKRILVQYSNVLSGFKRFGVIDSLHTSNFH